MPPHGSPADPSTPADLEAELSALKSLRVFPVKIIGTVAQT